MSCNIALAPRVILVVFLATLDPPQRLSALLLRNAVKIYEKAQKGEEYWDLQTFKKLEETLDPLPGLLNLEESVILCTLSDGLS